MKLLRQAVRSQENFAWIGKRNSVGYGHVRQFDVDNSVLQNRVSPQNRFDPVDFTQDDEGRIAIYRPPSLPYPEGTRGQLDRLRTGG
ncbi:hypothetical protein SAMN05878503_12817 [Cereibacter ovatus]|uniref:Uncharacterized protein n=1 Tax=Cereibacter ovatus TaxID=439529 RepID=A0A285D5B1_9RHOB|nr:hypothetical protein SAMN05878503_12817 [Cereibacter ovatus]